MKNKTLPCPFCGEEDVPDITGGYRDYRCECCFCGVHSQSGDNEKEALLNWNTRPKPKDTDAYNQGFIDATNKMIEILEKFNE